MMLCPCCKQPLPETVDLLVDESSGIVVRNGHYVALTRQEFAVFEALRAAGGKVMTKQAIMDAVYWRASSDEEPEIKIIDVWVCKMRKKLLALGIEIGTAWGAGYRLHPVATMRSAA